MPRNTRNIAAEKTRTTTIHATHKTEEELRAEDEAERLAAEEERRREKAEEERLEAEAEAERLAAEEEQRREEANAENDFWVRMENINDELESAGIKVDGEMKFIIERRNPSTTQMRYCKTYHNNFPDLDAIGKDLGGGDYTVKIHAPSKKDGRLRYCKFLKFSIDTIDYPVKKEKIEEPVATAVTATDPMFLFMQQQQRQHEEFMAVIKSQKEGGSKTTELIEILTAIRAFSPEKPNTEISPEHIIKELGTMFKAGMDMSARMLETKEKDGLGDVALDVLKTALEKIDLSNILAPNTKQLSPAPAGPAATVAAAGTVKQTMQEVLQAVNEYFQDIIVAYDSQVYVEPYFFAEKALKNKRYEVIKTWALTKTSEEIFVMLSQGALKEKMKDVDFKDYLETILDFTKNFDILVFDEEANNGRGEWIKKQPYAAVNDDNSGTGTSKSDGNNNNGGDSGVSAGSGG